MRHPASKICPVNDKRYDKATEQLRKLLGSFDNMAAQCYSHTGESLSGNAIRRWFRTRSVPVEYAAVFEDLTFGEVSISDFFPWLSKRSI